MRIFRPRSAAEPKILDGLDLHGERRRDPRHHGPERRGQVDLVACWRKPGYKISGGEILFKGEDLLEMSPDERAAKGVFLAFQYPLEIPASPP